MRQLIPLDVYKWDLSSLESCGLPAALANRIWTFKSLWLICMHPDDIAKVGAVFSAAAAYVLIRDDVLRLLHMTCRYIYRI